MLFTSLSKPLVQFNQTVVKLHLLIVSYWLKPLAFKAHTSLKRNMEGFLEKSGRIKTAWKSAVESHHDLEKYL